MPETEDRTLSALRRVLDILAELRQHCPWDRAQTPESIRNYLLEESFETVEAVAEGDPARVAEELGDLLFMLLFLAHLFEEQGDFDLASVMERSADKMVSRHPHVFGDAEVADASEVKQNWERIKMAEKGHRASVLDGISKTLPGLMRANRVISRLKRANISGLKGEKAPLWERVRELEEKGPGATVSPGELGEIILDMAALAVDAGVNPETALLDSLKELEKRARRAEEKAGHEED